VVRAWDPEVIDQAIPRLPEPLSTDHKGAASDEPPVELAPGALRVWRGERPKLKDDSQLDRSSTLVKIGRVLYDAHATRSAIVAALKERDIALGYRKYTDRADADERYHEIVDELERAGRNGRAPLVVGSTRDEPSFNLTDVGNAERLVARHGDDLRYCFPWGKWLAWDGRRWKVDASGEVARRAVETVRSIYAEAAATDAERKEIARWAMASESRHRVEAMVALARALGNVPVAPEELDADPWLLNVENGTLDLRTGDLRPHDRADLLTKLAGVGYDPDALAPTWGAALERWLPSEGLRRFAQRLVGYALTGDVSEQVLPFLHGPGANGKTTFINTVLAVAGDYGQQAAPDLLLAKHGTHPTELADLYGARAVASIEVEDGRRLAESLVKQITGGDKIRARRMREDFWEFDPTHKVLLVANHKPVIRGTDHAIWRRVKLVPFDNVIPKAEQDPRLPEKLRAELPGVLAWAVRGCVEWQAEGLGEPDEVRVATDSYRQESDALTGFIEDACTVHPDAWVKFKDLWAAYGKWAAATNERYQLSRQQFADRLTERGFEADRGTGNVAIRRGIALRFDDAPDPSGVNSTPPESGPRAAQGPPKGDKLVNSGANTGEGVNSKNTCKTDNSASGVNSSYPESGMNAGNLSYTRSYRNPVNSVNSVNSEDASARRGDSLIPDYNAMVEDRMAGLEARCLHGFGHGKGCYVCDPEHPGREDGHSS
jgi:P4 family phage/plasmid primase-like protien